MLEENKALGELMASDKGSIQGSVKGSIANVTGENKPFGVPFDLNKLCNFGFDVLKEAIEYLAK